MRSASAYINKVRIDTIVRNNKVEYPGRVARTFQLLAPSCPINPNFEVIDYVGVPSVCKVKNTCNTCNVDGYTQGFKLTVYSKDDYSYDPMTDPSLASDPFNSSFWPPYMMPEPNVVGTGNIVPYDTGTFVWVTEFSFIINALPFTFIFKLDADDGIAIKNLNTSTVVADRWAIAPSHTFGGPYVYSNPVTVTSCVTKFLMVSANTVFPNNTYNLSVSYILPPPGPPPYTQLQLDAQPSYPIYPYCFLEP